MRSKSFLAVIWAVATVVAVAIVWQSLGFVSTRTEDDGTALGGGSSTSVVTPVTEGSSGPGGTGVAGGGPAGTTKVPATAVDGSGPPVTDPIGTASTTPPTLTTLSPGVPADAVDQTFELVGGTAVVRYSSTGVTVLYAVPANGYQVKVEPEEGGTKVEFRSEGHRSRVTVWWDNGPQHSPLEERDED